MTAQAPTSKLGYRPELDGVRAIAVVLVIGAHMRTLLPHAGDVRLHAGFFGVDVFFVLSGFLITRLFLEERAHKGDVWLPGFFGRRALRLLPALVFGIAVAAVAASMLGRNGPGMPVHEAALWTVLSVANWSGESLGLLAHMWSLGVEQQFYLVWPFVLLLCLAIKLRVRSLAVALIVASVGVAVARVFVLHGDGSNQLVWGVLRIDAILLGSALGAVLVVDRGRAHRFLADRRVVAAAAVTTVGYLVYAEASARLGRGAFNKDLLIVGTVGATVLLGSLVASPGSAPRVLSSKTAVSLGRLSYAIYLVHYPVFAVLAFLGPRNVLLAVPVALTVTFVLAMVAHHLIEQPALKLKGMFGTPRPKARDASFDRERVGGRSDAGLQVQRRRGEEELVDPVGRAILR